MRIVLAMDKFKGCLDAAQVCRALRRGILRASPGAEVVDLPVADGGDGTVDAFLRAGWTKVSAPCRGPTGVAITADYAVNGTTAVVELARSCGLARLPGGRLAPRQASTHGLGDLLADAIRNGARQVIVALGGSASTDGGAGLLSALGAGLAGHDGQPIKAGLEGLDALASVDLGPARRALGGVRLVVASDVTAPLIGAGGAAGMFGPQKGLTGDDIPAADAALTRLADALLAASGRDIRHSPGAGAAGGTGAALLALGADMRPGGALVLDAIDAGAVIAGAGLVITGEGALDRQTLQGKAPARVAARARAARVPVIAVCGRNDLGASAGTEFRAVYSLSELEPDPARCLRNAVPLLARTGARIAGDMQRGALL